MKKGIGKNSSNVIAVSLLVLRFAKGIPAIVTKTPFVNGKIFTGRALLNKSFDIKHPTKPGWRLRHTCIEGKLR